MHRADGPKVCPTHPNFKSEKADGCSWVTQPPAKMPVFTPPQVLLPRFWLFWLFCSHAHGLLHCLQTSDSCVPAFVPPEPDSGWPELAFELQPPLAERQLFLWYHEVMVETLGFPYGYGFSFIFWFIQTENDSGLPTESHTAITPLHESCFKSCLYP